MKTISVVVSTHREQNNPYFRANLQLLQPCSQVETICVDGGSDDATATIAQGLGAQVISLPQSNRASRINLGLAHSQGDLVLLLHPRCLLPTDGIAALLAANCRGWGCFQHRFDHKGIHYRLASAYSNHVRLKWQKIAYLDHCPFMTRQIAHSIVIPNVDIFEDTELSKILRKIAKPLVLPVSVLVSPIRFEKNGFIKQTLLNQWLKIQYAFGAHHQAMNQCYEKNLDLN